MNPSPIRSVCVSTLVVLVWTLVPGIALAQNDTALLDEVRRLAERVERLEARNRELEEHLAQYPSAPEATTKGGSELVARVAAVEVQTLSMQKQVSQISALDGVTVSANLTSVFQQALRGGNKTASRDARMSYRGDIAVTLPGGEIGEAEGRIFLHARFGQGEGLGLARSYTSTPNSTAFRVADAMADDAHLVVAQAWYQLSAPLGARAGQEVPRDQFSLTFGKVDPFAFFDQNAIADDETVHFLDNVFVHNPLLDAGGDAGLDRYGFTPGFVLRYTHAHSDSTRWGLSFGAFAAGEGACFNGSPGNPFSILQAELTHEHDGRSGTYRVYAWRNGRAQDFDGVSAIHRGLGASVDQQINGAVSVFGRVGFQLAGRVRADRALTLGGELKGGAWGREADIFGLAGAWLRTAAAFGRESASVDADGDGVADFGYTASGFERIAELYYRVPLTRRFDLSVDYQHLAHLAGNSASGPTQIMGLRARVGF